MKEYFETFCISDGIATLKNTSRNGYSYRSGLKRKK